SAAGPRWEAARRSRRSRSDPRHALARTPCVRAWIAVVVLVGCGGAAPSPSDAMAMPDAHAYLGTNARALDGTPLELAARHGMLVELDALAPDAPRFDAEGATIVPAFVDAHVHFSYDPVEAAHAAGGIAVALDLASPIEALAIHDDPLVVLRAG